MVKIKVLYIVSTLKRSGPINVLSNIVKFLDRDIFEPYILTLSPESGDTLEPDFVDMGVNVDSLKLSRISGAIRGKKHLNDFITKIQPDVIHTHGLRPDHMSSKFLQKYNRLTTLHNYPFEDYTMKFGRVRGVLMAKTHIKALKKLQLVLTCSESICEMMVKDGLKNASPIQNGINIDKFTTTSDSEKIEVRKKLKIPPYKKVFLFVGSLIDRKDPKTAIKGYLESEINFDSCLVILGDGPLMEVLKKQYARCDNIIFKGHVTNVHEYQMAADYLIAPSLSEGFGLMIVEALASGLPCLLTDIPPFKEIIGNSNAGIFFEKGNSKDLSNKISMVTKENSDVRKWEAREIAVRSFSAQMMSNKYQELYKNLLIR